MSTTDNHPTRRERKTARHIWLTLVSGGAYAVLAWCYFLSPWFLAASIPCALISVIFAFLWIRSLDEGKQQAHYVAWYWGGSAGLTFSMLCFLGLIPLMFGAGDRMADIFASVNATHPAGMAFAVGFVLGGTPAVIGYSIWHAIVMAKRDGSAQ